MIARAERDRTRHRFRDAANRYLLAASAASEFGDGEASARYRIAAASALEDGEDYEGALGLLEQMGAVIDSNSLLSAEYSLVRGVVLEQLERPSEALDEYRYSAEVFLANQSLEESILARANLIGILLSLGETDQARAEFQRSIADIDQHGVTDVIIPVLESLEVLLGDEPTSE